MKISVITITYRDGELLRRAISSVQRQQLPPHVELEHIIVTSDTDGDALAICEEARRAGSIVLKAEARGCYNAINKGIERASGDIIGLLHGSDMYACDDALAKVARIFMENKPDFIYGDVRYIKASSPEKTLRYYSGRDFRPELLLKGIAPPHPSLYIKKDVMSAVGPYCEDYLIGADFELFIRLFYGKRHYSHCYLPEALTAMEIGGLSTSLYNILVVNTREKMRALRSNGLAASLTAILSRYFIHLKRK
ncbi:MAG: glycosyltransferase [Muribaculaceae bacterium]|nr:glycosyltransferase [Muribaculaceae bacterium]